MFQHQRIPPGRLHFHIAGESSSSEMPSPYCSGLPVVDPPSTAVVLELALNIFPPSGFAASGVQLSGADATGKVHSLSRRYQRSTRQSCRISSVHLETFSHRMDVLDLLTPSTGEATPLQHRGSDGRTFSLCVTRAGKLGKENGAHGGWLRQYRFGRCT